MKPNYRPGKPATKGRSTRKAIAGAKPLLVKQTNIDFVDAPKKRMKGAEYEAFSHEGIRRLPKRGKTIS